MKYVDTRDGEVLSRNEVRERIQEKAKCDHSNISNDFREFLDDEKSIEDIYNIYRGYSSDNLQDEYEAWLENHLDKVNVLAYYSITSEVLDLLERAFYLCPGVDDISSIISAVKDGNVEFLKGWIENAL
jgi:hypothetical protein